MFTNEYGRSSCCLSQSARPPEVPLHRHNGDRQALSFAHPNLLALSGQKYCIYLMEAQSHNQNNALVTLNYFFLWSGFCFSSPVYMGSHKWLRVKKRGERGKKTFAACGERVKAEEWWPAGLTLEQSPQSLPKTRREEEKEEEGIEWASNKRRKEGRRRSRRRKGV